MTGPARVVAVRDIVRRTDGSVVPRGRLGTVVCLISESAGGLFAVKWDDDGPYRSMAVTGSSVEVLQ